MDLEGVLIEHKVFGKGTIISNTDRDLYARFTAGDKRFLFPDCFDSVLSITDPETAKNIKSEIVKLATTDSKPAFNQNEQESGLLSRKILRKEDYLTICVEHTPRIKEIVERRKINKLVHFTRLENLISILIHGFVPINKQEEIGIESLHNDPLRLDLQLNYTSFSIEQPNYKLFFRFRTDSYPESNWVVLVIDSKIIFNLQHIKFFYKTNAASFGYKPVDWTTLCRANTLESVFCEKFRTKSGNIIKREDLQLEDNMPTNPQAEILISEVIEPSYIKAICFDTKNTLRNCLQNPNGEIISQFNPQVDPKCFRPRHDYNFWQEKTHGY